MHFRLAMAALLAACASGSSPVTDCPVDANQERFISDTVNLCVYWHCRLGRTEIHQCAVGTRLPSYFTIGNTPPCTIPTTTCLRCNCSLDTPDPPAEVIDYCSALQPCNPECTCVNTDYDFWCSCPFVVEEKPPEIHVVPPSGVCFVNPCKNGGTCMEVWQDYFCQCVPSWTGKNCEFSFCNPNPCHNGGTCFATALTFFCVCPPCFAEPCCATGSQSCACNDSCTLPSAPTCYDYRGTLGEPMHRCDCPLCKYGPTCSIPSQTCACNNNCPARSTCEDFVDQNAVANHRCVCDACLTGPFCNETIQSCSCSNDCLEGSTCIDRADLSGRLLPVCACPSCRTGPTCKQRDIATCACNPCGARYKVCEDADLGSGLPRVCRNTVSSTGSVYTVVFQENNIEYDTQFLPLELYVSASDDDSQARFLTVSAPLGGCDNFSTASAVVQPATVHRFEVPLCMRCDGTGFCDKAIKIQEMRNLSITMYGLNRMMFSADGFLALPDEKAGLDFFAVAYKPTISTQLAIVSLSDDTHVSIRLSADAEELGADPDGILRLTMQKNQVYQVQGTRTSLFVGTDLTGTYVHSDKPVNVFSGSIRDYVPRADPLYNNDAKSRDHLVEQLVPVQSWSNSFGYVPIANRAVGDIVRVIAPSVVADTIRVYSSASPDTVLFSFRTPLPLLAPFVEFHLQSDAVYYIEASQPIFVAQLTLSKDGDDGSSYKYGNESVHDPSLITVPAVEQYSNNYAITTPLFSGGFNSKFGPRPYNRTYLLLVADISIRDTILVNTTRVSTLSFVRPWTRIPAAGQSLYGGAIVLPHGTNIIRHPDGNARFGCWVYGHDDRESYGFPCGLSLAKRNEL